MSYKKDDIKARLQAYLKRTGKELPQAQCESFAKNGEKLGLYYTAMMHCRSEADVLRRYRGKISDYYLQDLLSLKSNREMLKKTFTRLTEDFSIAAKHYTGIDESGQQEILGFPYRISNEVFQEMNRANGFFREMGV